MIEKMSILYIDDEHENLTLFKGNFRREFEIVTEAQPALALELIGNKKFDIIITDQRMPDMSGVEFLEKALTISPSSVRILLTGFVDIATARDAINRGKVFYYINKPWNKEDLLFVLLKAVDHSILIRENKNLIEKLKEAVGELETFLYRASHDLRAPISTQLGLISLLKLQLQGSSTEYLYKMEEVVAKLEATIEKIHILSQISNEKLAEAGELSLTCSSIVSSVLEKFNENIQADKFTVITEIDEPNLKISYSQKIKILLSYIIQNSVQYHRPSETNKKITIRCIHNKENNTLNLSVEDNGIGISNEHIENVFNAFYRGTFESTGNGLGLYLVKKICDYLGGTVSIWSDGVSSTKTEVTLPVY